MESVTVDKSELIKTIQDNLKEHVSIYDEAVVKYRSQLEKKISDMLDQVRSGDDVPHVIDLIKPVTYAKQYEQALRMLEMSVDEQITLEEETFKNLVMDDWRWKENFLHSNSSYSPKAFAASRSI